MEVEGSFDNWTSRQALQQSGKDFTIVKLLPSGVYQVLLGLLPATGRSCSLVMPYPMSLQPPLRS